MADDVPRARKDPAERLRGKQVAFAGRLASMTREEAAEMIRHAGGEPVRVPTRRTAYVVVGQDALSGARTPRVNELLERAQRLRQQGHGIEIMGEQRLLEMLSGAAETPDAERQRLYTTAQLSRILRIPGALIRSWVRRGLIQPERTIHRLDLFDFSQVAALKTLRGLTREGVPLTRIRRSLEQLSRWLPETRTTLAQLAKLEKNGQLLVRLEDGHLAEPTGQVRLGFEGQATGSARPLVRSRSQGVYEARADEWFERALQLEDAGRLDQSALAYERSLLVGGPCAEAAFNLGNVLFALGRVSESRSRYLEALEIDREYVEAWNNLASVSAELDRWDEAIDAAREALRIAPDYPDAHYNLAVALYLRGSKDDARRHAAIYLEHDSTSEWARQLRDQLGL